MGAKKFSLKTELLWSTIWPEAKERILRAVWCGNCRTSVEIVDYTEREKNGNLVLEGACRVCGQRVCRVIETSEARIPPN
jgi:hypothetical protein